MTGDLASKNRAPQNGAKNLLVVGVIITLIVGGGIAMILSHQGQKKEPKERTAPVTVATAKTDEVPIEIRTIGNVLPYSVVNVTPQVGGQLQKVYFTQGDYVHKGDLLFQIDPRPYQAAVEQAHGNVEKDAAQVDVAQSNLAKDVASIGQMEANLRKDQAQLQYARNEMARYNSLFKQGAVSQEQGEQMITNAAAANATIQADTKAIENAKAVTKADRGQIDSAKGTLSADQATERTARINLSWTQLRAPLDGRTGSLQVYEGNVVAANNATALVSIEQIEPIYIQFTLPEQYLDEIRRSMSNHTLKVQALVEGQKTNSVEGTVSFLESTVNTTSGTISLRATFKNLDHKLFPGQFVDVLVSMPPPGQSVVVPSAAVQISQKGNAVYVLKPNGTVDFVPVTMDRSYGDLAAISKGLNAGDVVVVDGQLQLTPGAKVKVVTDKQGGKSGRHGVGGGAGGASQPNDPDVTPNTPTNASQGVNGTSGGDSGTNTSSPDGSPSSAPSAVPGQPDGGGHRHGHGNGHHQSNPEMQ